MVASGLFYSYNGPGAKVSQAMIESWWRQGIISGAKAHYDGIRAFSETDFTEDLKVIDVPTLVMPGDDDQIVLRAALGEAPQEGHPEGLRKVLSPMRRTTRTFPVACPLECAIETSPNSEL